jgi:hypothetical protein
MAKKKKTAAVLNLQAKRRAVERHGLDLTKHQRHRLIWDIRTGKATLLERCSNTRTKWLATLDNNRLVVVYDKQRHTIATVLPPGCEEFKRWERATSESAKPRE